MLKLDYDHTTTIDTIRLLRKRLRKHIPHAVKMLAISGKSKGTALTARNPNSAIAAHQSLDVIGMERIEAAVGDGLPTAFIARELRMTMGQFNSWIFGDPERIQRFARIVNGRAYMKAMQIRQDILDYSGVMDESDLARLRLQMQVAKDVETAVVPPVKKDAGDSGTHVHFDFGAVFNGLQQPMRVVNP